jgi:DNA (cytosine-5)-methyltransferase 1
MGMQLEGISGVKGAKSHSVTTVPAIDLFAGPGGLSEGFGRYQGRQTRFNVRLSIEKDPVACKTLILRGFVREFDGRVLPKQYYQYIKGDAEKLAELKLMPEWHRAQEHVRSWTLGEQDTTAAGYVSPHDLHGTIHAALGGATSWALLGGPPCQAYSIVGRSRMTGVGIAAKGKDFSEARIKALRTKRADDFASDRRHTLYREYLRVVAVHQPPVFVMENVKGILSARLPNYRIEDGATSMGMFDRIRQDLEDPWNALKDDPDYEMLNALRRRFDTKRRKYRLVSFVAKVGDDLFGKISGSDFLIKAELYGVPQKRHRVIVLGIRDDIQLNCRPLSVSATTTVRKIIEDMPSIRSALSTEKRTRSVYGKDSSTNWCRAVADETRLVLKEIQNQKLKEKLGSLVDRATTTLSTGRAFISSRDSLTRAPKPLRKWLLDPHLGGVIQHYSRSHMASDLARYLYMSSAAALSTSKASASPTLEDWPKILLPNHSNVRHLRGRNIVDGFFDRFRVQVWNHPSSTITSHIHKDGHYFIHPDPRQCRSLSVREAARLQTFPENYFFEGNRTEQLIQVGNAVPPYLAVQLADRVAEILSNLS